jgi:hypothetical protein
MELVLGDFPIVEGPRLVCPKVVFEPIALFPFPHRRLNL